MCYNEKTKSTGCNFKYSVLLQVLLPERTLSIFLSNKKDSALCFHKKTLAKKVIFQNFESAVTLTELP